MTRSNNENSTYVLLGIPILLLIISLFLFKEENKTIATIKGFNPYLNILPNNYSRALNNIKVNDSSFFSTTIENFSIRKLLIFKVHPTDKEMKTDFTVELYPTQKTLLKGNAEFLIFKITKDAVLFNKEEKTFGVFKLPLPLIDIEKLIIKSRVVKKKELPWESVIKTPFKTLDKQEDVIKVKDNEVQKKLLLFSSLFTKQLSNYGFEYLPSQLKEKDGKIFRFYTPINKFISANKFTLIKVAKPKRFWNKFISKDNTLLQELELIGNDKDNVRQLFNNYLKENLKFNTVFDVKKLAFYNALKSVFTEDCKVEAYFLFNKENILEPFHAISSCPKENTLMYLNPSEIQDQNYLQQYANAIAKVSQINLYTTLIKDNKAFKGEVALINKYNPKHIFDFDIIRANQRVLHKSLNASSALKSELISMDNNKMVISVFNTSNYGIELLELKHNNKKTIASLNPIVGIRSNQKDTITVDLPRSFENLFVSKKKKTTGFILPKHIYELNIKYRISGVNKTQTSSIIPYQKSGEVEDDLFRNLTYINNHRYIFIDEEKKEISFSKDSVVIASPLVIQKGYVFKLNPGSIVNIMDGGKIISHSPLSFIGSQKNPVKVYSSDARGQGILVLSEQKKSTLKHVVFDQLRNPTHGSWGVTGAVTFYESPVNLEYVSVKNNKCEDALNIVRTNFTMNQVTILNTQSDGFDGDFVKGSIINCQFDNLGNDAIDVSGSDLIIKNVTISNAGDKGLSAGENSKMAIDGINISNSAIAIAGKDLSVVNAKNLKISNTQLGFTAFQKKPEFGPSKITVIGISMTGIETKYLIESSSSLFVDNKKIETTQNVKNRMYGVEFGRSSAETRNTPK
jgi:hypothetical protein